MGTTAARIILLGLAVGLASCAELSKELLPRPPTLKQQSLLLKIGMSEQEVATLLGPPSQAEVGTCGAGTCKTLNYGKGQIRGITAHFTEKTGEWRLNSWTVGLYADQG
jgi:hypothetical protein